MMSADAGGAPDTSVASVTITVAAIVRTRRIANGVSSALVRSFL
jgi:hypothetical protein